MLLKSNSGERCMLRWAASKYLVRNHRYTTELLLEVFNRTFESKRLLLHNSTILKIWFSYLFASLNLWCICEKTKSSFGLKCWTKFVYKCWSICLHAEGTYRHSNIWNTSPAHWKWFPHRPVWFISIVVRWGWFGCFVFANQGRSWII